ncbi:hypothetical protein CHCC14809_2188 [Bacillus licheniformis]|uniref:Uncharacterized protein n=2 Tax=Bacillus subtilis group TaxID=653685 RepID=A0ABY3FR20_9BACI|nr:MULTISPECIES: hypothetical protein [Bacillus]MCY9239104.1 hypothetical protein [Bacillus licheniformis]MDE1398224.1 hypothetical protein [Bacillus licheniformis]MEC2046253.1 hypothetical protein [Bacillus licheniformis]MEC5235778.1 hypothetical protein [Bacillus licheniformis]MED4326151.1 hypothetical protein [Bacillus licheniformis]
MENFVAILIFTLPGLLSYFWIQLFGLHPASKHINFEIAAISAILWFPVGMIVLGIYQLAAKIVNANSVNNPWLSVHTLSDVLELSNKLGFLVYFVSFSVIFSFLFSWFVSRFGYKWMIDLVNVVRKGSKTAKLSGTSTVWNETFLKDNTQYVSFRKIDNPNEVIYGEIKKVSRPVELERNLLLSNSEHWTNILKDNKDVEVDEIFVDTKTGFIISIYNTNDALKAQDKYNATFESDAD